MALNVFVRQPFTESNNEEAKETLQEAMDQLEKLREPFSLNFLTPLQAQSSSSFKDFFQREEKMDFTPINFRRYRLKRLDQADAFVVLRKGLSESTSFEIAYNIFKGPKAPLFFAIWRQTPIRTTLLQELEELCEVEYITFDSAAELGPPLTQFFSRITERQRRGRERERGRGDY